MPLKVQERDLEAIAKEVPGTDDKRDPARLTRLWYYYKKGGTPLYREIHEEMLRAGMAVSMKNADAVLVLSEAQFEGLGYAQGAFAITEQPTEIAWGTKDGGWTKLEPDARLLDELIHELGHILGLDHPSKQCDLSKIEGPDKMKAYYECCEQSPGGKDVMSYCRSRGKVKDDFFYSFTECTRSFLRTETLPSLYWGDRKPRQTSACL